MKTKAVIYCRVSTDKQVREGNGLAGQEKRCQDFAKQNGLIVDKVFRDAGYSGALMNRPSIHALLQHISKNNGGFVVIIDDLSRLSRDNVDYYFLKNVVESSGNELRCVNMILEKTPDGEFRELLMVGFSQLERKKNTERVINRMTARLQLGYWTFDCPPGYKYTKAPDGGGILILDEPKASIVKEAMEGFASGRFLTQADIKDFLTTKRFCHKGEFKEVNHKQAGRILTQPLYGGFIHFPSWGIHMVKGKHPAIVSPEIYYKIQEKLKLRANKQFTRKCDNEDFPIRGFALCPECETPYTGSWSTGRKGIQYAYYRCNNKECLLPKKNIKKSALEEIFINALQEITPVDQLINLTKAIALDVFSNRAEQQDATLEETQREMKKIGSFSFEGAL
ncbi:recombinase [Legionella taurinensis]|uniref:Recombinase n=1 Tax=Legionella taurinensis TaxID=70611 RepID=A0AB38N2M0_9GAMM|nr:recombinase family protein [Legionella taurinensis]PUT38751.1 recombinase [Legionella taurinensis]PUT40130.1 recombinase [Legionella taurinensis]PUT42282.1 recombinase [Legionella taurinensis]PUT46053.1 recombinase [Legionella taurinensis]TID31674.1 recombinase [Legionella taurinensis]